MSQIIIPQPVEETIDGLQFRVIPFAAYYALGLSAKLAKALGPAISSLSGLDQDADLREIAPALRQALGSLDPVEAQGLALELLKQTSVLIDDGGKALRRIELTSQQRFDQVFNGRFKTMFKVLGFAMRVNFASFTDGSESAPAAPQLPDS